MKQNKEIIKGFFETGNKPSQEEYYDTLDSFWHKEEMIPSENFNGGISGGSKSLIATSGRVVLNTNLDWVTNADNLLGINTYSSSEACGNGDNPQYKWEHLGHTIPAGYKINKLIIIASSLEGLDDLKLQCVKRMKVNNGEWNDVNDDSQFTNTLLYEGLWKENEEQGFYTDILYYKAKRVFTMDTTNSNNVFNKSGELFMYFKPFGTFPSVAFKYSMSIEIEKI